MTKSKANIYYQQIYTVRVHDSHIPSNSVTLQ